jgi:hypothetical protein
MTVVFRESALHALGHIRNDDKETFLHVRRTLAALADEPRGDRRREDEGDQGPPVDPAGVAVAAVQPVQLGDGDPLLASGRRSSC